MWPNIQLPLTISETTIDPAISSEMEDGIVVTRPRYTRIRRRWELSWQNMIAADYQTLRAFYNTQKGGSLSFLWGNPVGTDISPVTVRFTGDLTGKAAPMGVYSVTLTLEEV